MEEQNNHNAWPFTPLAFDGSPNHTCYMAEAHQNHYFNLAATARNETPYVHNTVPQWIYSQQTPQNYVEFLAENGAPETQKIICHRSCNEGELLSYLSGSEGQTPSQNSSEGYTPAASVFPSTVPSNNSRQKAAGADRLRRLRISQGLDALQELLPHSKEGSKALVLDDIIDHIKYLQLQVKELSQRRLGGESSSTPFILLEGYGHYLLRDQVQSEPLEEMMGKLMEVNPLAAKQLLESRGLRVMPMALAEGLCPQT